MRLYSAIVAVMSVVIFATCATGAGAVSFAGSPVEQAFADVASGKVQGIDSRAMTFTIKKTGGTQTFRTSEDTLFTLDGREVGMMEALKEGRSARVTYANGVASKVDVTSS